MTPARQREYAEAFRAAMRLDMERMCEPLSLVASRWIGLVQLASRRPGAAVDSITGPTYAEILAVNALLIYLDRAGRPAPELT